MIGSFNKEAQEVWDFVRCQRADGTYYGTRGKCRKGNEAGAKQEEAPKAKKEKAPKTPKVKKEKPAPKPAPAPAPPEPKGYKPKEGGPEPRKGLRGLKDRITGGKKKELDNLVDDVDTVRQNMYRHVDRLHSAKREAKTKKEKENAQAAIDKAEAHMQRSLARIPVNKKFAEDLKKNLPPNVSAKVDDDTGEIILTQRVGRHKIETDFSQGSGFNYRVNGGHDVGTVKDRKQQLRIAMAVRSQYDALVKSLPEGTVIKTSAYDDDGKGDARQKAYERIGFGAPEVKGGDMFAMKKNGRMVPATYSDHSKAFLDPSTVWFAEEEGTDEREEVKAWFQIVSGINVGV